MEAITMMSSHDNLINQFLNWETFLHTYAEDIKLPFHLRN